MLDSLVDEPEVVVAGTSCFFFRSSRRNCLDTKKSRTFLSTR
jgi:hypothetical protein